MNDLDLDVTDHAGKDGFVKVFVRGEEIVLVVKDSDPSHAVVCPTTEDAQSIIAALLTAIREIKHGPQTD
jgi:hypothetical protein